jgi:hypothetical protein
MVTEKNFGHSKLSFANNRKDFLSIIKVYLIVFTIQLLILEKKIFKEFVHILPIFWTCVGRHMGVLGTFCDILKGISHRSFIWKIGLFSGIFQEIYLFLA